MIACDRLWTIYGHPLTRWGETIQFPRIENPAVAYRGSLADCTPPIARP